MITTFLSKTMPNMIFKKKNETYLGQYFRKLAPQKKNLLPDSISVTKFRIFELLYGIKTITDT